MYNYPRVIYYSDGKHLTESSVNVLVTVSQPNLTKSLIRQPILQDGN